MMKFLKVAESIGVLKIIIDQRKLAAFFLLAFVPTVVFITQTKTNPIPMGDFAFQPMWLAVVIDLAFILYFMAITEYHFDKTRGLITRKTQLFGHTLREKAHPLLEIEEIQVKQEKHKNYTYYAVGLKLKNGAYKSITTVANEAEAKDLVSRIRNYT